jgi:hypothetical protein
MVCAALLTGPAGLTTQIVTHSQSPRLAAHLEEMGFPMEVITTRWFMCAYTTTLPKEVLISTCPLHLLLLLRPRS